MQHRPPCATRRTVTPRSAGAPSLGAAAAFLLLALTACSGDGSPRAGSGSGSGTGPGGAYLLSADDLQVVGSSEALTLVRDLEVASDGTIWVLDEHPPFFVGFREDGEVVAEVGRRGEGPREFVQPVGLLAPKGEAPGIQGIWTFDRQRHALVRVSRLQEPDAANMAEVEGTSIPLSREAVRPASLLSRTGGIPGVYPWMTALGGSAFMAHSGDATARGSGYWKARVVEIPLESGEAMERWKMEDLLPAPEARYPGVTEFLPVPLWAICPDGGGWLYDPARHGVRSLQTPEGPEQALPPARQVAFTLDRLVDMLLPMIVEEVPSSERPPDEVLRGELAGEIEPMIDQFARVFPEYYQMHCAPDGTLWLQHFDWEDGYAGAGWSWERLRAGGADPEVRTVRFPEGFRVFRIHSDRAWGIVLDELGVPSVAWIGLP